MSPIDISANLSGTYNSSEDPPFARSTPRAQRATETQSAISGYVFFEALEGHSPVSNLNSKQKADAIVPCQKQRAPSSQPTATASSKVKLESRFPSEIKRQTSFPFCTCPVRYCGGTTLIWMSTWTLIKTDSNSSEAFFCRPFLSPKQ
ncbi:hypothetical protein CEXT_710431 [Caerostris extrusa]|uniref:Uncharacterized protein n=1 Tax=Caerostris extrusa TaxID=172846 RepID=A0AAV4S478_CAEEX|nr:hypothetical protein CEXT_710431 [Caerostris extrusa]